MLCMSHQQSAPSPKKFGTFLGVYTPSVLTILGVMMYLRFGWVVGNTGMPLALLVVVMASSITLITGLSASAVATNMRVGVGGEYYMVSRSLGLELGGAIGIPLFLCRTLSLTLYAFGLAESLTFLWPPEWGAPPLQLLTAGIIVITTAIAGRSAELSLKLQIPIMVAVGLSVLALAIGVLSSGVTTPEWTPHYARSAPGGFWYVFAVFFPSVTGFTAGIGMSGDLKDPQRSIPKGTLLAVLTGTLTYLAILVLLSVSAKLDGNTLALIDPSAPPVWTKVALFGPYLVFPGAWGAILSSAFGSALGGPRVLQALANDGLAPRILARTSSTGQPTIATWAAGFMALAAVVLGDLNAVGRWVTIFFLTLYVTINMAAALESLVGDPSYRPTIKVPWFVSLLGSAGAVVMMFLINYWACFAALTLELALYSYLRKKALQSSWGDVRAGLWTALARFALLKLKGRTEQARNWRPNILLFSANPANQMGLVRMANWFNQNRGLVTLCQVIEGNLDEENKRLAKRLKRMEDSLDEEGLVAFCEVDIVRDFESGVINIAQANGYAGLQSNTLMFGWPENDKGLEMLLRVTRRVSCLEKNSILVRLPKSEKKFKRDRIDVWWRGMHHNGDLMLLLAHLLNLNADWRQAELFVRSIVQSEEERVAMTARLEEMILDARIDARADVIVQQDGDDVADLMHRSSSQADIAFLGLAPPDSGAEPEYAVRLAHLARGFNAAILVHNTGPFAGKLI